ncbi:MAG TPA: 4'-phosphopantetheinyl transferase superfamily protein [Lentimicrobium sp.]|nr:4'-phosphopantetheinyl transferase superfamily protein [Lentimicrobium sp.]
MTRLFACQLLDEAYFEKMKPQMLSHVPVSCADKALSYYHSNDTQRHLIGELLARYALKESSGIWHKEPFSTGDKGKPHPDGLNGTHFNVSHSGHWVVVAVSTDIVGVDVEHVRKMPEGVAYRYFSEPEKQLLDAADNDAEKAHTFFSLWTLKESFIKAIGKGLTKSLSSFTVIRKDDGNYILLPDPETKDFHLKSYTFEEGYKLAVCAKDADFDDKVNILNIDNLLPV